MEEIFLPIDHIERWHQLVAARRRQHDGMRGTQTGEDYWARRAEEFHRFSQEAAQGPDPLLDALSRLARPEDTVLDIGAGTGRHALRIALQVARVIAVDPSAAMLRFLREESERRDLGNITIIEGAWPDVRDGVPLADIAISAHVLYPIDDVAGFLRAMDAHARRVCVLHLMVWQPWFDRPLGPSGPDLFEAAHGEPRIPQPTYIDATNVLYQLGCYANVEISMIENTRGFGSLDDAVERLAFSLAAEGEAKQERLRAALAAFFVQLPDGRLGVTTRRYPLATLWWQAGSLG